MTIVNRQVAIRMIVIVMTANIIIRHVNTANPMTLNVIIVKDSAGRVVTVYELGKNVCVEKGQQNQYNR